MSASSMKTAIIASVVATILGASLALPISASAGAPLGSISIKGGTALTPGQTATVQIMCQQDGTATNGAHLFAPVATLWLGGAGGQMVWQFSSRQPGACVWISGTNITAFEMPTLATISIPSWATPGPTILVATDPQGQVIARVSVTIAGTVPTASTTPNPYLTVPTGKTGKGAKTSVTSPSSTPKTSTSIKSVVRVVAPRGHRTPWWRALIDRLAHLF